MVGRNQASPNHRRGGVLAHEGVERASHRGHHRSGGGQSHRDVGAAAHCYT